MTTDLSEAQSTAEHPLAVGDVMSRRVVTITMDDTLARIQALFRHHGFHHLLVVEGGRLVGVVSDRDVLRALSPNIGTLGETERDRATLLKRAHQIMSRRLLAVRRDVSIEMAARLLVDSGVSCLPVVAGGGLLEGLVSWKDVLRALLPQSAPVPAP